MSYGLYISKSTPIFVYLNMTTRLWPALHQFGLHLYYYLRSDFSYSSSHVNVIVILNEFLYIFYYIIKNEFILIISYFKKEDNSYIVLLS